MATCTHTVICEYGRLGCIICRKITCYIICRMSSTLFYIVLAMLVMIYIGPKHIIIWTILDILGVFAIFLFFMIWFTYEFFLSNFSILFWQCIGNSRNVQVVVLSYKYYAMILRQIISMATCVHTSIFLLIFGVSIVVNCLLCHLTLIISMRMRLFLPCN